MKIINKILLIDDDEIFNIIHKKIINSFNVVKTIDVAYNGKEALQFFIEPQVVYPDLVFVDIDMPIMDGFEFLEEVKNNFNDNLNSTKFIMLTSSINLRDKEKAKEYKVADFISKPLTKEIFQEVIDKLYPPSPE